MKKLQQTHQSWSVRQLLKVLIENALPSAEKLSEKSLVLPAQAGKPALRPFRSTGPLSEDIESYRGHRHIEWVYGLSGQAELALSGHSYLVSQGDWVIIPSNAPHLERIHAPGVPYCLVWFGIYNHMVAIHAGAYSQNRFELIEGASIFNCAAIGRLFHEGTEEALQKRLAWRHQLRARAGEALVQIARHIEQHGLSASKQEFLNKIEQTKSYIQAHHAEALTLQRIAQLVYLSPNYFSSLFSHATGTTVIEYIQEIRLSEARRLLDETALPVKKVGERVGFRSMTNFCRSFKRRTGKSPSDYRKKKAL
jgi:AraC-like DNA-binding protein